LVSAGTASIGIDRHLSLPLVKVARILWKSPRF
jgi:hypothetical protein